MTAPAALRPYPPPPRPAPEALTVYDRALSRAAAGQPILLTLVDDTGGEHPVDPALWCRQHVPGDTGLLSRCTSATLDVGCGPGRLAGALNRRDVPALGIDLSRVAIRLARQRGVPVLRRDVFGPLPDVGRWRNVLLADGNIGIGGDPGMLLSRCRAVLGPAGQIHVELAGTEARSWAGWVRIRTNAGESGGPVGNGRGSNNAGDGRQRTDDARRSDGDESSAPFRWASVTVADIADVAATAGLRTRDVWREAGRWFASLVSG